MCVLRGHVLMSCMHEHVFRLSAVGTAVVAAPASALVPVSDTQLSALAAQHAALSLENSQLQFQVDAAERERLEIVSDSARQIQLLKQQLQEVCLSRLCYTDKLYICTSAFVLIALQSAPAGIICKRNDEI